MTADRNHKKNTDNKLVLPFIISDITKEIYWTKLHKENLQSSNSMAGYGVEKLLTRQK